MRYKVQFRITGEDKTLTGDIFCISSKVLFLSITKYKYNYPIHINSIISLECIKP